MSTSVKSAICYYILLHLMCWNLEARSEVTSFLTQELSRNGGILSLSRSILKLGVPECLKGSIDIAASMSRLKAKILSIVSWS